MRKQTKIVAVASAAALLAIGASMTSFAAAGWVDEDGTWYYYDKDGNRVEDQWKRSGDNWYWLSSEEGGAMAVDTLVDDDSDIYYVDTNGVMVRNTWVKVVNEEQDDDDDPAEYNYYYMQSNGKAYKAPENGTTKFHTIDGKRYAFDDDGKMLYGWVGNDSTRLSGETDWADVSGDEVYYCGNWDDGAMKTGWQKIYVTMPEDEEEEEHWFWFKSNGRRFQLTDTDDDAGKNYSEKTINSKKYAFDNHGVMVYEWGYIGTGGSVSSASGWKYFRDPEDGARATKGWFKVVAPDDGNENIFDDVTLSGFANVDAEDETERWYYADGNGNLYEGAIKRIKGKYYGFRPDDDGEGKGGAMLTGLVLLRMNPAKGGEILEVIDDSVDSDELTDLLNDKYKVVNANHNFVSGINSASAETMEDVYLYYFGNPDDEDSDGAMKTGNVTLNLDGDSYQFKFSKSGGAEGKGKGYTGVDDKKYVYKYGCRIKADSDDKYKLVFVQEKVNDLKDKEIPGMTIVDVYDNDEMAALRDAYLDAYYVGPESRDYNDVKYLPTSAFTYPNWKSYLVSSSGTIVREKTAGKDGADWYFYVKDGEDGNGIKMYTSDKKITNMATAEKGGQLLTNWKNGVLTPAEAAAKAE